VTVVSGRVGIAHPGIGYRRPVQLLRALLRRPAWAGQPLGAEWEARLSAPWASFCDDEPIGAAG
jgi:hypothetical protein